MGRPAVLESGLFLIAYGLSDKESETFHFLLGLFMASFYYLFWIYLIPLAFIRRGYLFAIIAGLAGWLTYAGTEYFEVVFSLLTVGANKVPAGCGM